MFTVSVRAVTPMSGTMRMRQVITWFLLAPDRSSYLRTITVPNGEKKTNTTNETTV